MTTTYAWRTDQPPRTRGCPATGWVHEGDPPWRVIVSEDRAELETFGPRGWTVTEYDGDEQVILFSEWLKPPHRSDTAVSALDAISSDDPREAHSQADAILLQLVPPEVAAAYERLVERCAWFAYA